MPNAPADQTVDDELLAIEASAREPDEDQPEYTEAELDRLTDSERAAILGTAEVEEAEAPVVEEEPAPEAEPEPRIDTSAADRALSEAQRVAAEAATKVAALDTKAADVEARMDALQSQYDEAELGFDAFKAQQKALIEEQRKIDREIGVIEGRTAAAQAAAEEQARVIHAAENQRWADACAGFIAANPAFVAEAHKDGFNAEVEAITADPRFAKLSFAQQLQRAAQRYALTPEGEALTIAATQAAPKPAAAPKPKAPIGAKEDGTAPKPLATKPVPTLAKVPAETIDPNQSPIAAISARLQRENDPLVKERIMAGLSEDMLDRVLSYGG